MTRNPMLLKLRLVFSFLLLAATVAVVWHFGRRPKPTAALGQAGLWVVSDTVTLRGDAEPLTSSAIWDGTSIKLAGSRNEVVAWQVAARAAEAVAQASLKLAPFRSGEQSLPGGAVALFREHYLEVTAPSQLSSTEPVPHGLGPGWYPCQAVPLKVGEAVEVPAGRVAAFWVDVTIPADARPGLYTSSLEVTAGSQRATWPVQLEVLPLSMPRETHFTNWFYYGPEMLAEFYQTQNDAELMAYEQVYQQLAHDHRMTLATEPMLGDGRFNWSAWWARYGGYLDGSAFTRGPGRGAGATCWPIGLSHEATPEDFAAACRSAVAFFKGRGLLEKVFTCIWDEPGDKAAYDRIRELGRQVDEAVGNRLPVMVTEQVQPQEPGWGSLLPA
ncbi:MAG: hypothetical protein HUU35_19400, partial [Armatimonadetes bacterium]|nr:hypothetical protein [Armatimonadota bacterium]